MISLYLLPPPFHSSKSLHCAMTIPDLNANNQGKRPPPGFIRKYILGKPRWFKVEMRVLSTLTEDGKKSTQNFRGRIPLKFCVLFFVIFSVYAISKIKHLVFTQKRASPAIISYHKCDNPFLYHKNNFVYLNHPFDRLFLTSYLTKNLWYSNE